MKIKEKMTVICMTLVNYASRLHAARYEMLIVDLFDQYEYKAYGGSV
jgi:hypothetical protein